MVSRVRPTSLALCLRLSTRFRQFSSVANYFARSEVRSLIRSDGNSRSHVGAQQASLPTGLLLEGLGKLQRELDLAGRNVEQGDQRKKNRQSRKAKSERIEIRRAIAKIRKALVGGAN